MSDELQAWCETTVSRRDHEQERRTLVQRTDPQLVTDTKVTPVPNYGRTASGYGPKIPTRHMVKYAGRWRRVYVMCYGNSDSPYLIVGGRDVFLDTDTEYRLSGQ